MSHTDRVVVQGEVSPGFESLKQLFTDQMSKRTEIQGQLCVYVGDEQVVDLWANREGDETFGPDSLVNIFSSGKSLESVAMASLAEKGFVDYNARIMDYWSEFSGAGKGETTIADMMRHEAGLAAFNTSLDHSDLLTENIKQNRVGKVIESHSQAFRNEGPREYHAMTRGWIVNEVFRRVDPSGRTIGEYLRDEIQQPLEADIYVGLRDEELARRAPVVLLPPGAHLKESLKPAFMNRQVKHNVFMLAGNLMPAIPMLRNSARRGVPPPIVGFQDLDFFNHENMARGETPSANTHASARGLAKLAAALANKGEWQGRKVVGETGWASMHALPKAASMGLPTTFTQGGVALFGDEDAALSPIGKALNKGREGFYGWMGLGGSIFQWHPEKKIGFAFVPTQLHLLDLVNERGKAFQGELLKVF